MSKVHKYTDKELDSLHRVSLDMADVFWNFCKEHSLVAYFCGGGCIGALRHRGFIPWDDDLDFFMPRDDYEKMCKLWPFSEYADRYVLCVQDKSHIDHNLFATIRDAQTTYVKPYQSKLDIVHGAVLDILPLDGYPDSRIRRKIQIVWAYIYSLFLAQTIPVNHGGIYSFGSRILLTFFKSKKIRYKIWSTAKKHMTKYPMSSCTYTTELCSGPKYMKNKYKTEWFSKAVEVPFEDKMMPIPVGADKYLRTAFGDYMKLPPPHMRHTDHDCILFDMDRPYTYYREKLIKRKRRI